jgi:hypothetical protein
VTLCGVICLSLLCISLPAVVTLWLAAIGAGMASRMERRRDGE